MPKLPTFLLLILGFAIPKEDHNNSFHSVVLDMGSFGVHGIFQADSIELPLIDICDPKIQKSTYFKQILNKLVSDYLLFA